jgi:pimeloyl-ACP methyl ester carboxylesterase
LFSIAGILTTLRNSILPLGTHTRWLCDTARGVKMPFANSAGFKIYYETHGEGPCIVFIHGAGGSHVAWWQQTAYLRQSFRIVTLDLRGFGNSDTVPDGPDALDFPHDVLAVIQAADVRAATLIGQSMGAVAALRAAIAGPSRVKAVILAHSLGGLAHPELTPLVRADRANAENLSVLDRLLTKDFQRSGPAKTFLFQQIGTFNNAKMEDLRNVPLPDLASMMLKTRECVSASWQGTRTPCSLRLRCARLTPYSPTRRFAWCRTHRIRCIGKRLSCSIKPYSAFWSRSIRRWPTTSRLRSGSDSGGQNALPRPCHTFNRRRQPFK